MKRARPARKATLAPMVPRGQLVLKAWQVLMVPQAHAARQGHKVLLDLRGQLDRQAPPA